MSGPAWHLQYENPKFGFLFGVTKTKYIFQTYQRIRELSLLVDLFIIFLAICTSKYCIVLVLINNSQFSKQNRRIVSIFKSPRLFEQIKTNVFVFNFHSPSRLYMRKHVSVHETALRRS